jgi:hypothetical protein
MAYELPAYIRDANSDSPELRYEWDDSRPRRAYGFGSGDALIAELSGVTPRAQIAAAIGCYEWVIGRFDRLLVDPKPRMFAEAAWCANISIHYLDYLELDRENWRGPVRGPVWSAITILNELIFLYEEDAEPALRVAWLANLALHVLPNRQPFDEWLAFAVGRLRALYTLPAADPFESLFENDRGGPLVPREALDPSIDFSEEWSVVLADRFLRQVDYTDNYFLQSPDAMAEDGFEGTAYRIDT